MSEFNSRRDTELGPVENGIHVQTPGAGATTVIDLDTVLPSVYSEQEYLTFICDQSIFYKYSSNAAATISSAATAGADRAFNRPANTVTREVPPARYLVMTTVAACQIRLYKSSKVLG